MNRILFEPSEIKAGRVTISDARAEHIRTILHGSVGQELKTGEVDGLLGTGIIEAIEGEAVTIAVSHTRASRQPWIDLLLAPPRPRVMKRLLPQLAALGVGEMVLVGAKKTDKDFWGATLLKAENYRPLLVDGLMQAGTTILPHLRVEKSLRRYLKMAGAELEGRCKLLAHPGEHATREVPPLTGFTRRPLVAIGPEGGWTDDEIETFSALGFRQYALGSRILRTDTATVAILAQLMKEWDA